MKKDRLNDLLPVSIDEGYVECKFRESRDEKGRLTLKRGADRRALIKGLPVCNTESKKEEKF